MPKSNGTANCALFPLQKWQEQDILLLESGNQICADAVVTDGGIEVNESLLTGESDAVYKKAGDSLLSGSSVISGTCRATVLRVGSDSYASKLTKEAKKTKAMHSELVGSMQKVTRLTSFCIVPLGILLFVEALLFRDSSMYDAVVGTSAGLLGMLPERTVSADQRQPGSPAPLPFPRKMYWCRISTPWKIWRTWMCFA